MECCSSPIILLALLINHKSEIMHAVNIQISSLKGLHCIVCLYFLREKNHIYPKRTRKRLGSLNVFCTLTCTNSWIFLEKNTQQC